MGMKSIYLIIPVAAVLLLIGCKGGKKEVVSEVSGPRVMARAVPERMDDFVFENDLVAGRFYGKALEGDPTSPGIDVWVKLPGPLVADDWYSHAVADPEYYHHDHGGKDCYKVSVSLGGGASAPLVGGELRYPATNWRESAILSQSDDMVSFVLKYPAWDAGGVEVSLEKTVTVTAGSYFCKVEDRYFGDFDTLDVAAGLWVHDMDAEGLKIRSDGKKTSLGSAGHYVALWEPASDQSIETEDGMIGLAVVMPSAHSGDLLSNGDKVHSIRIATVHSGEPLIYWFGSCWSKGEIKDFQQWTNIVEALSTD